MSCEVQIRTLLQHAHAELTHSTIYKNDKPTKPLVQRTVAKCMALIETTDQFFIDVAKSINFGPLQEHNIQPQLDSLYHSYADIVAHNQKSSLIIWDTYERFLDESLVKKIHVFIDENYYLIDVIRDRYKEGGFYQQSVILFLYWMLKKKRNRLIEDWPLSRSALEPLATDMGISTSVD